MAKKKTKMLTNREWWAKHREQFEQTDRHVKELIAKLEAKISDERAARGETAA